MNKNRMLIAFLLEYKKAMTELKNTFCEMTFSDFKKTRDQNTNDPDCKSIETVVTHVIHSGYTYTSYINSLFDNEWVDYDKTMTSIAFCISELDKVLVFTENSFSPLWEKTDDEIITYRVDTRWGVNYDVEQLLEHAIVHVLRHRRQIEYFLKN